MKQSEPLELVQPGTLARPGPIGRLVRLCLGVFCLYALWEIVRFFEATSAAPISTLANRVLVLAAPIWLINYVVNIGFSKSWGRGPLVVSVSVLGFLAAVAFLLFGTFEHVIFGMPLNLWLSYFYSHLGIAFVMAAILATPGCEMRSIPELAGRLRGRSSDEHLCPVSFLNKVDKWELGKGVKS